jgi:hypothetical protein
VAVCAVSAGAAAGAGASAAGAGAGAGSVTSSLGFSLAHAAKRLTNTILRTSFFIAISNISVIV